MEIQKNVSLAQFTTFKIGGPAKFFVEIKNEEELREAANFGEKNRLPVFILGGGSNLLFPDAGWPGLVIRICFKEVDYPAEPYEQGKKYTVKVGAGVLVVPLAFDLSKRGLRGMEWAGGLPGTIGGAVRGNAGAFRFETSRNVKSVLVFHQGKIKKMLPEECVFGYRTSLFKSFLSDAIILSVELDLEAGNPEESKKELEGYLKHRQESQPPFPSAGCIFKNFTFSDPQEVGEHLKHLMMENFWQYKKVPAAWLIENSGLKGAHVGEAEVSPQHGNFIVNTGNAKAEDILQLIKKVKETVWEKFGVRLEEEVQIVASGQDNNQKNSSEESKSLFK